MKNLTTRFKEEVGRDPVKGELFNDGEYLYQLRGQWEQLCLMEQPNLEPSSALMLEVGPGDYVSADFPNMLALQIEIHKGDPKSTLEDLVASILRLFKEAGWKDTKGLTGVPGLVRVYKDVAAVEADDRHYVSDLEAVREQIVDGRSVIEFVAEWSGVFRPTFLRSDAIQKVEFVEEAEENDN